ncbi:MAG: thiamine pyrophosphate-binding protein [Pigmentiphaga sp.]
MQGANEQRSESHGDSAPINNRSVEALYQGLKAGGADFLVHLPDSVLFKSLPRIQADPSIQTYVCSREDEGIAMATGAYLGGKVPVVMMEGSGLGYSGLILARALIQRTPMLILASHTRALGEPYEYHMAGCLTAQGTLDGLHIPYVEIDDPSRIRRSVEQALVTVKGQKTVVGLLFASYVFEEEAA